MAWTILIGVLMLLPSDTQVVDRTSGTFGGTDLTDAVGHVVLFGILTALWYAALLARPAALIRAAALALGLGIVLETAQSVVPGRGFSLLDFGANVLGPALSVATLRRWFSRRTPVR